MLNLKIKNGKRGFTLIELLVVIAIIGILSAVVLASLNTARQKSRDARRVSDVQQIQLALEFYFDDNRAYPPTIATLETDGYLPSTPVDPLGAAYGYDVPGAPILDYLLFVTLEQAGHSATLNDLDGTQGAGIACGTAGPTDDVYCVGP